MTGTEAGTEAAVTRPVAAAGGDDSPPAAPPTALLAMLALVANSAIWGSSWWPFRYLQAQGVHPLWATVFIFMVSAACVSVARPSAWRHVIRQPSLWLLAVAAGLTNLAFNWAVSIGEVVRVVLLFYLAPLWSVLLARWLLAERIDAWVALRVALALAGAALVVGVDASAGTTSAGARLGLADMLAIVGGMAFALINVELRRSRDLDAGGRALAMFLGGAGLPAVLCLVFWVGFPQAGILPPSELKAVWLFPLFGLSALFLLGNLALQYGAGRLPAQVTAVVMPIEVVFAAGTAVWWGDEMLRWPVVVGGLLILTASLLAARQPSN